MRNVLKNKFIYFIVLGLFLFIPKTVFAGYNAFNFKAPTFYIENGLKQQLQLPTSVITYSGGQYYNFSSSSSDFGNASTLMHFTTNIAIQGNFDPSKYDSMIISVYGTPIYDFQANSGTCIPYGSIGGMDMDSNFIVSTYVCQVPTSSSVWLDAYMTPNLNFALRMNDRITFIEKNTDTSNVAGAINKQTEEMVKAMEEQNKTQQETNDKLDEIQNSDISDKDKEMPDDSSYQDYNSTEQELLDKASDVDLNALDVGLDVKSSSWVWDTLTRLFQSNSVVFGMLIGILSLGVIKLILGR